MFKKILYPTDFSDVANSAIAFVKQFKDAGAEEIQETCSCRKKIATQQ